MSIFQELCNEPDDIKRRVDILKVISEESRQKVESILSDKTTTSNVVSGKKGGVMRIEYQNAHGKILLTPTSIDRVDEFGTAWNVASSETIQTPNN